MPAPTGLIALDYDGKPIEDSYGSVMWFVDTEHAKEALPFKEYRLIRLVKAVKKRKKRGPKKE